MATETSVSNIALLRVQAQQIQSLNDNSPEGRACKVLFPVNRLAVLRAFDWGFASKFLTLALTTEVFPGWTYAYSYPKDCLAAREIYNDAAAGDSIYYDPDVDNTSAEDKIDFKKAISAGLNKVVILTNKEDAVLRYTADVEDLNLFDALALEALSLRLASDLAFVLKKDKVLQKELKLEAASKIGTSQEVDANEGRKRLDDMSSFTRSRS